MFGSPFELVVARRSGVLLPDRNTSTSDLSIPGAIVIALRILMVAKMLEHSRVSYLSFASLSRGRPFRHHIATRCCRDELTFLLLDWNAVKRVGWPFLLRPISLVYERPVVQAG